MMTKSFNLPADPRIRRILMIKWSALGDVVISTAMFNDIRNAFPHATIDLHTLPLMSSFSLMIPVSTNFARSM